MACRPGAAGTVSTANGAAAYSSSRTRSITAATIPQTPAATLRRMQPEIDQLFRLDGRVAIVTGASRGLGERFVRVLRAAGAEVVAAGRDAGALERLAAETGASVEVGDVRDDAHLEQLVQHALARHGRLDIAVPNAGIHEVVPFEEQDLAQLRELIEVNLVSVMVLAQLAGRAMLAAGSGSIVNVASILGLVAPGDTAMAGYTATKAGVISLTRDLAAEWGRRGVRVNALCPGYFPTDMTGGLTHPGAIKRIERRTLLGRVPRVDELDGSLLFLASDASSYMTGQTLVIDGGWTAW
jgi:NAD(P)-dependent dehydrogenase (short-subunit alcohol dehydrogenase family)